MLSRFFTAILAAACILLALAIVRIAKIPPGRGNASLAFSPSRVTDAEQSLIDRPVPEMRLDNVTLDSAILKLSERTGVYIQVNWSELERVDVTKSSAVRIHFAHATLGEALQGLASHFSRGDRKLGFFIADGVVTFTTLDDASRHPITEYLNIHPLLDKIWANLDAMAGATVADRPSVDALCEQIGAMLMDNIEPDSWANAGGSIGRIRWINGVLIVTQSPKNLQKVRMALSRLWSAERGADLHQAPPTRAVTAPIRSKRLPPTTDGASGDRVTQYFNIRPIVALLTSNDGPVRFSDGDNQWLTPHEAMEGIMELVVGALPPESWRDADGVVTVSKLGGMLLVTQTPENLDTVQIVLSRLYQSALSNDFSPASALPATQPADPDQPTTAYVNIRPLVLALAGIQNAPKPDPHDTWKSLEATPAVQVIAYLTDHVARPTWRSTGGKFGEMHELSGILVITNTPANIQAVRRELGRLWLAILDGRFPPQTQPSADSHGP